MLLLELYDTGWHYKWHESGADGAKDITAIVMDGTRKMEFTAEQHGKFWNLQFAEVRKGEREYGITGKGKEFKVFATLKKFTGECIEKFSPPEFVFTADKTEEGGEKRADLYDKMFRRFKFPGYTLHRESLTTMDTFRLKRDTK